MSPPPACAASLPEHLLALCLKPLDNAQELAQAATVSSEWRTVARSDSLWEFRYGADFLHRRQGLAGSHSGSSCVGCPAASLFSPPAPVGAPRRAPLPPAGSTSWREAYRERAETEANWRRGQCGWRRLQGHRDYIRCAQLVGASLATCSGSYMQRDCSIRLWDVESGACVEHMPGHAGPIWSMHYDGRRLASCDDEGAVRLWDAESHRVGVSDALAPHSLKCVGLDERHMAAAGESGLLAVWSVDDVQRALQDAAPPSGRQDDEEMEESEGAAQQPRLPSWHAVALDSAAGAEAALARAPQAPGAGLPVDTSTLQIEDGLCVTGDAGGAGGPSRVHMWSVGGDGELAYLRGLPGHQRGVSTLSFQRATGQLVAGCGGGAVNVWSLDRGVLLHELRGHSADILCHQQGASTLATGAADASVRLWDLRSGRAQHIVALPSFPYSLQMDDRRLAVGCSDGTVLVADLRCTSSGGSCSGGGGPADGPSPLQAHAVLPVHRERVWALALAPSRLISASLDATIVVRCFEPGAADQEGMEQGATTGGDSDGSDSDGSDGSEVGEEESESEWGGDDGSGSEAGSEADP